MAGAAGRRGTAGSEIGAGAACGAGAGSCRRGAAKAARPETSGGVYAANGDGTGAAIAISAATAAAPPVDARGVIAGGAVAATMRGSPSSGVGAALAISPRVARVA